MASRTFALMFEIEDGGVSTACKWSKESLKSENIVMVLDEENMAVWLWYGSKRGLVSKRTALRQAQSLKGHGYTIGKSIVGRGLDTINEIDERKIGREPATTELNDKFMALLSKPVSDAGGFVVNFGAAGEPLPIEEHFEEPAPIEMPVIEPKATAAIDPTPSPAPISMDPQPSPAPVSMEPQPSPEPPAVSTPSDDGIQPMQYDSVEVESSDAGAPMKETMDYPVEAAEYVDGGEVPEPEPIVRASGAMETVQKACVIVSILSQFKDIWVSRLSDGNGTISVEYMDGPIAKFHIEDGKVKFDEQAFRDIEPGQKSQIKSVFDSLIEAIKN